MVSAVVGFDNLFGLATAAINLSRRRWVLILRAARRFGWRLSVMEGWLLPVSGFNQGVVNDAERSKGIGFPIGSPPIPKQRFRFEDITRSGVRQSFGCQLNQGRWLSRLVHFGRTLNSFDAAYDIFKDFAITAEETHLTFNLKHERVDPLYRSWGLPRKPTKSPTNSCSTVPSERSGSVRTSAIQRQSSEHTVILKSNTA